jgi:DNA-binding HxlR family transcriptional regulator
VSGRSYGDQCGVARSLDIIGERWALLVIRELLLGPKRFSDLMTGLPGASPNVISQRLRDLADDGVLRQRELPPPARVKIYELTDWGHELEPVLEHLGRWGDHAPVPEGNPPSLDSLLLALQASADPARVAGRYELVIGGIPIGVDATLAQVRIRRESVPFQRPDATLSTDEATLRAVCFGQRSVQDAVSDGDLRMTGSADAVDRLTALLLTLLTRRRLPAAAPGTT